MVRAPGSLRKLPQIFAPLIFVLRGRRCDSTAAADCLYLQGFLNAGRGINLPGYFMLAGYPDIHLMNGLKFLISVLVALLAISLCSAGNLNAWRAGFIVPAGNVIGGFCAARALSLLSHRRYR